MLKNRVALYSICGSKPLTFDEVWERLDNGLQVWFRIFIKGEPREPGIYVRAKGETMRDIEYYALGYENSDSSKLVERIDYND